MKICLDKIILVTLLLFASLNLIAQNNHVDSLKKKLQFQQDDTTKILNLLDISWATDDPKAALKYAEDALSLSNKLNYVRGKGNAYNRIGRAYYDDHNDSAAIKNYFIALDFRKQAGDSGRLWGPLLNIADVYQRANNFKQAIAYNQAGLVNLKKTTDTNNIFELYFTISRLYNAAQDYASAVKNIYNALEFFKRSGDQLAVANAYIYIASVYSMQNNYPEALKNFYTSLSLHERLGNKTGIATCLQYIGAHYQGMGNDSDAIRSLLAAAKIRKQIGDQAGLGQTYATLAGIYSDHGKYSDAFDKAYAALKIFKQPGMPSWGTTMGYQLIGSICQAQGDTARSRNNKAIADIKFLEAKNNYLLSIQEHRKTGYAEGWEEGYLNMGKIEMRLKNYSVARAYFDSSLNIAIAYNNKNSLQYIYQGLATLDSLNGDYKQAYKNYTNYILYRDSSNSEENKKKFLQVKMQNEFDKKETIAKAVQDKKDAEAKRLKTLQYITIAALTVFVMAVLIIAVIQYRNNKQKQLANAALQQQKEKIENTLSELKATQAQLIQSEKMASLGELTAGIAHEIQNPLNFVNNFSEVNKEMLEELKAERLKPEAERDDTLENELINDVIDNEEKINHHGKRADAIVKGMLQHSRKSEGKKEPTDINALCDEYLRLSYHGLRAKDKSFNADFKTEFDKNWKNKHHTTGYWKSVVEFI